MELSRPIKGYAYFDFKCSSCGAILQVNYDEIKFPGGTRCWCGNAIKFDPFKLQFLIDYINDKPKNNVRDNNSSGRNMANNEKDEVIDSLMKLGYNKKEAERVVEIYINTCVTGEELLKKCLSERMKK